MCKTMMMFRPIRGEKRKETRICRWRSLILERVPWWCMASLSEASYYSRYSETLTYGDILRQQRSAFSILYRCYLRPHSFRYILDFTLIVTARRYLCFHNGITTALIIPQQSSWCSRLAKKDGYQPRDEAALLETPNVAKHTYYLDTTNYDSHGDCDVILFCFVDRFRGRDSKRNENRLSNKGPSVAIFRLLTRMEINGPAGW